MNDRFIIGLGCGEHEYTVNGVKYIVTSKFKPVDFKNFKDTLADAIENISKTIWQNGQITILAVQ